jgi:hypothetical protein
MLRKINGTNFFHIKLLERTNIKCQTGLVLPPPQVFYLNGHALDVIPSLSNLKVLTVTARNLNLDLCFKFQCCHCQYLEI